MGVKGLATLVEANPDLLQCVCLKDTPLVVDGNALCYQLFRFCRINFRFGGDYEVLAEAVAEFVQSFRLASVRLIVVFDGLLETDEWKQSTMVVRQKQRLSVAQKVAQGSNPSSYLLPLLASRTVLQTLRANNDVVTVHQCAVEADAVIAGLANAVKCPVLSQDSDFFIYDLKHGYVPMETLEWGQLIPLYSSPSSMSPASGGVRAKIYKNSFLLDYYPQLDLDLLPLFSAVMGNDFEQDHVSFKNLLRTLPRMEATSSSRKFHRQGSCRKQYNMVDLLKWFEGKSRTEVIKEMLTTVKTFKRQHWRRYLANASFMYIRARSTEYVTSDTDVLTCQTLLSEFPLLPEWFLSAYCVGRIPCQFIYIMKYLKIFLPTLVEDFSKNSVFDCCRTLRVEVYKILLTSANVYCVREYLRSSNRLVLKKVLFQEASMHLYNMESFDVAQRRNVLLKTCGKTWSEELGRFSSSMILFILSLTYWTSSDESNVAKQYVFAIVFVGFLLNLSKLQPIYSDEVTAEEMDEETKSFLETIRRLKRTTASTTKQEIAAVVKFAHALNEWQACFKGVLWLNTALMWPFDEHTSPAHFYSGRKAFVASWYFAQNNSYKRLFEGFPSVLQKFDVFYSLVQTVIGTRINQINSCGKRRSSEIQRNSSNRCKKRKSRIVLTMTDSASGDETKQEENSRIKEEWYNEENRFAALALDNG
ncbi:unnamed protein product [Soboliphyme baturini]|uniref:XPG_I_2 domain-containing protein n=1 Tax=Soboliphyme baturini TaxID=241478 RepID=A0A183ISX9_9BILA|nr:unnamed protein product [Soboliphyme baturini]